MILLLSRADSQPSGSDDVYYRKEPLPEKECRLKIVVGENEYRRFHSYGWSYQLHLIPVGELGKSPDVEIEVTTEGRTEIIGPLLVSADIAVRRTWSPTGRGR